MSDEIQMELKLDEAQPLGTPVMDPTEAQLMQAEYGLLLNKLIGACQEQTVPVAIAACMSASFCIAADYARTAEEARQYLASCFADANAKLEEAIEMRDRMNTNGSNSEPDTGVVGGEN